MITIKMWGTEATLENGKWKCKNKVLKSMLVNFKYDMLEGYNPFPDLALAELVVKELKGAEIIKVTGEPEYVKGRVY